MPLPKRSIEEIANKSDSSDDDYSDHPRRSRKTTAKSKSKKKGPAKKKPRRRYSNEDDVVSDDESLSESDELSAPDSDEAEDPLAATNASGRRARRAALNRPVYNVDASSEGAEDEDEEENDDEEEGDEEVEAGQYQRSRPRTQNQILKLKIRPDALSQMPSDPLPTRRQSTRRTRASSERGTHSPDGTAAKRPRSSRHTRASSKLANVEEEEDVEMGQDEEVEAFNETTLGVKGSQLEILESDPREPEDGDQQKEQPEEEGFVPESENGDAKDENANADEAGNEEEDEDDEGPVTRRRSRPSRNQQTEDEAQPDAEEEAPRTRRSGRKKPPKSSQRKDEESDFEPEDEDSNDEDEMSGSEAAGPSPRKASQAREEEDDSGGPRRPNLRRRPPRSGAQSETGGDIAEELAEELEDLKGSRSRRRLQPEIVYEKPRRSRKDVDYRIIRPDLLLANEEAENEITESPSRRGRGGGSSWQRTLFPTYGPFGGGGPSAILGPPGAPAATGGVDSDSSDDEGMQHPKGAGSLSAHPPGMGHLSAAQTHGADVAQGLSGTPANLGKVKDKQTLADADPLGVDTNVNFDGVGGLQGHIDQLKEMVSLPLLYPEIFQRFHIVPPRGVLFHGPPGTGKTLLARALANSVSSEGRKVTFYMRKGADALSKWVGEAERQLRLLFDEARKTQPSIIFFDEIDGTYRCPPTFQGEMTDLL